MMKVVYFSCWSNPTYMKSNDRERMEAFVCEYSGKCEMYEQGKCVCENLFGGWIKCPHSKFVKESGLTKRARNFGDAACRWKERYHTDIQTENSRLCKCGNYIYLPYPHLNVWGNKVDDALVEDHFIPVGLFDVHMVEKIVNHRPRALMGGEIESFQKEEVPKFIQQLSENFPDIFKEFIEEHPEQVERFVSISQNHVGRRAYLHTMKDGANFYDCHKNLWVKKDGFIVCENYKTSIHFPAGRKVRKCLHEITDDMVVEVRSNDFVSSETKFVD